MIYLVIEICGLKILTKLDSIYINELIVTINKFISSISGKFIQSNADNLIYSISESSADKQKNLSSIFCIYNFLKKEKDKLQGFNIFLDVFQNNTENDIIYQLEDKLFRIRNDELFCMGKCGYLYFQKYAEFRKFDNIWEVISQKEEYISSFKENSRYLVNNAIVDEIIDSILKLSYKKKSYDYISICGPPDSGKNYFTTLALSGINNKAEEVNWIIFFGKDGITNPYSELSAGLDQSFIEKADSYLNSTQKLIFKRKKMFLFPEDQVYYKEDFFIGLYLYISAYISHLKENLFPPVLVCDKIHLYPEDFKIELYKILNSLINTSGLILIVISEENNSYECFKGMVSYDIFVNRFSEEKLGELIKSNFPELNLSASKLLNMTTGRFTQLFHFLLLQGKETNPIDIKSPYNFSAKAAEGLNKIPGIVLFIISLTSGNINYDVLCAFLLEKKFIKAEIDSLLHELSDYFFIKSNPFLSTNIPDFTLFYKKEILNRSSELYTELADFFISKRITDNNIYLSSFFNNYLDKTKLVKYYLEIIYNKISLCDYNDIPKLFKIVASLLKNKTRTGIVLDLFIYFSSLKLRYALMLNDKVDANAGFLILKNRGKKEIDLIANERITALALYFYAVFDFDKALVLAKEVLLYSQRIDDEIKESNANIILGQILLSKQRIIEASDYFVLARDSGQIDTTMLESIKSFTYEAISLFLSGNLSKALQNTETVLSAADLTGRRTWELFNLFLRGRIFFELGQYQKSLVSFQQGLSICALYSLNDSKLKLYRWIARSFIYAGDITQGLNILQTSNNPVSEAMFFMGEAYLMKGQNKKALKLFSDALKLEKQSIRSFSPDGIFPVNTGFSSIEDRCIKDNNGHGVLLNQIKAFRGYLLGLCNMKEEGLNELSRITREEKLSEVDPYNRLYNFFYAETLSSTDGGDSLNKLTILNKSLKYVQEFASRMDNPRDRQSFLGKNYWNSRLLSEAHKYKLV